MIVVKECSKAVMRRLREPNFASRFFVGDGLDVGGAPDPLAMYAELFPRMGKMIVWDKGDGDGQKLAKVKDEQFDFLHSSHCLEHLEDPRDGLANWFRVIKPGGHLIVIVPDEDMYEQGSFPSVWNSDHKWTFTIFKTKSWCDKSVNVFDLILSLGERAEPLRIEKLDATFRYKLPRFPQTETPIGECAIEFVVRKRTDKELDYGGRKPVEATFSKKDVFLLTGKNVRGKYGGIRVN